MREIAGGYANLEYDVARGAAAARDVHAEKLIARLTGAEAAVVVNTTRRRHCSAGRVAQGREVIISRGELVEIGGGFRVPDVMAQSGALRAKGGRPTDARHDYAAAISDRTALILRVHRRTSRWSASRSARRRGAGGARPPLGIPVAEDLGSGAGGPDRDDQPEALRDEPIVSGASPRAPPSCASRGDKLLGGPQAASSRPPRGARTDPAAPADARAARRQADYAALEATLEQHAIGRGQEEVPVHRMLRMGADEIGRRADALATALTEAGWAARVIAGMSTVGGGSAPGSQLPTRLVEITHDGMTADQIEAHLRTLDPPVIARSQGDHLTLDLRTVSLDEQVLLVTLLRADANHKVTRTTKTL